ncbi:MAG: DNA primase [Microthrixaceae bacterium]
MGIVDEDIARVRAGSDIVAVVGQHTQLRRVGRRWVGLCPFHHEKSGSFSVNAEDGLYYCFGCQASGDVITFVREVQHLDFVAAVEHLASRAGITLRYDDNDGGAARDRTKRMRALVAEAEEWYHRSLLSSTDAGAARAYLRSRGLGRAEVERFRIGWAPNSWDALVRHLRAGDEDLSDTGLGLRNRVDRQQDFFRGRILFPIGDDQGRPIAFGGRKLPDGEGPKYQNSPETKLYNKRATLYGLHLAKADIVASGEVVVCEGYTDVIGFHRAGVPRAVATCGTALTEDHVRSLKRFTRRIVLAYDADEAGQHAAERVYEWESALDVEFAVIAMPRGADPDEMSRTDPAALAAAVANARPFLGFRVDRAIEAGDLSTPEGRARTASAAMAIIAEHPSQLLRDQYVMVVAGACRVDEQLVRDELARGPRPSPSPRSPAAGRPVGASASTSGRGADGEPPPWIRGEGPAEASGPVGVSPAARSQRSGRPRQVGSGDNPESEALRVLAQRRDEIEAMLSPVLFGDPDAGRLYAVLARHPTLLDAVADSDEATARRLRRLSVEDSFADADEVVTRLLAEAGRRAIARLETEARSSEDPLEFVPLLRWLKERVEALSEERLDTDSGDQLLAWLEENSVDEGEVVGVPADSYSSDGS